jgi:DNA-binding transcriptional LysR family regulator
MNNTRSIENFPFDLHALQAFVAVCESGSMNEAARRLGVTQSAVSQLVKSIEAQTGTVLLDREFRPSRPTVAGTTLLELANELLEHARRVSTLMADAARAGDALVRLGCVDSFAATVGPALIRALSGNSRQITLWSGLTPVLGEQLRKRELDVAIVTETAVPDPRIKQRLLLSEAFVAVLPKGRRRGHADVLQEIRQLPLIRYTRRSVIGQQVERYLQHVGIDSPRRFEFDATDPLLSLVASGLGYGITTPLCLWQARQYLPDVDVVPLPPGELGRREFFLMSRESEWERLSREVGSVARQALRQHTIPDIRKALPALPENAIHCPAR